MGRSRTTDWTITGAHLAERCQLFLIIALGESILDTGATFGDLSWSTVRVSAFVVAFVGTVALWLIYFYLRVTHHSWVTCLRHSHFRNSAMPTG